MTESTDDFEFHWPVAVEITASGVHGLEAIETQRTAVEKSSEPVQAQTQSVSNSNFARMELAANTAVSEGASLVNSTVHTHNPTHPLQRDVGETMNTQLNPCTASSNETASAKDTIAGYEVQFLDKELASEYNCHICFSVSRDPQQTKCCGSTYCLYCIQHALKESKEASCPSCKKKSVELIPDKAQKQKINKLKVQCPVAGCEWIVELADVEAHTRVPHPLSPPLKPQHSTLKQNRSHYSKNSQQQPLHYNTLPNHRHGRQFHSGNAVEQTVLSQPVFSENDQIAINAQDICDSSLEDRVPENINLTFPRPRIPRNRSASSPTPETTDPNQQRVPLYVNVDPNESQRAPDNDVDMTQIVPERNQDNSVSSYFNVTIRPRVPRRRAASASPAPQDQVDTTEPAHPHGSTQQSDQLLPPTTQPEPHDPSPAEQIHRSQSSPPSIPTETIATANTDTAFPPLYLDDFGLVPFQSDVSDLNIGTPDYVNGTLQNDHDNMPIQLPHETVEAFPYGDMETPLPSLPADLLALVDDPSQQPYPDEPISNGDPSGYLLSPSPPPGLQTPLLDLPQSPLYPQPDNDQPNSTSSSSQLRTDAQQLSENLPASQETVERGEYVNVQLQSKNDAAFDVLWVADSVNPEQDSAADYLEYTPTSPQVNTSDSGPMSPPVFNQPNSEDVAQQEDSDYVPILSPPLVDTSVNIDALQDQAQPQTELEYVEVTPQAIETAEVPIPPLVSIELHQAQARNTDDERASPLQLDGDHIYEPLPQAQSPLPSYEEEDQVEYVNVPIASPPPPLPPRSQSEPEPDEVEYVNVPIAPPPPPLPPRSQSVQPAPEPDQTEPTPPIPLRPRSTSPSAQQPSTTQPNQPQEGQLQTNDNEPTQSLVPIAPEPTAVEAEQNNVDAGPVLDQIIHELNQGDADVHEVADLPPQYDDLSQAPRYGDLVNNPPRPAPPVVDPLIIQNQNVDNAVPRQPQGPLQIENVQVCYQLGDQRLHKNSTAKKTKIILWFFLSILFAIIWFMLVIPLSIAALLNALNEVEEDRAPLIPSCHYSVPLLLVVLLMQLIVAIFIFYWFSKCCKCARSKKASRLATSLTAIVAVLYTIVVVGFAVSVYLFVDKEQSEDSSLSSEESVNNEGDDQEDCINRNSPEFFFATFYLVALLVFLIMGIMMTCCDYHYKRKQSNFFRYLRDTVQVYENAGRQDEDEETAL